jgi:hypothetical protein
VASDEALLIGFANAMAETATSKLQAAIAILNTLMADSCDRHLMGLQDDRDVS